MKIPLSWLQTFAPFPSDVALLTSMLDDLGLVVEGIERVGEGLEDVVCARVLSIEPIEGADKIRKITVDAGAEPLDIVCGAWNFQVGDVVPLAPVGAVLPGGFAIAKRKMRGVSSHGMLCSSKELGVGDDQGGLLVLTDLAGSDPGVKLMDLLGITADVVFDLSAEGNRPDAWSVLGEGPCRSSLTPGGRALIWRCQVVRQRNIHLCIGNKCGAESMQWVDGHFCTRCGRFGIASVDCSSSFTFGDAADQQRR